MNKKIALLFLIALFSSFIGKAQVSVVSIQLQSYNITPDALMAASISNLGNELQVQLVSKLYNFNNEVLLTVKSAPFILKKGLNSPFDGTRRVAGAEFSSGNQANYIKSTHGLPSGTYRVCIDVVLSQTLETQDQFCDELESDYNEYLFLVIPADKDTVVSTTPLLIWSHSEPFNVLSQGEYYRMVVSEIKDKQGADEAVTINTPLMVKNYLTTHNLQYPYDAKELKAGGRYAWQVQKIANGVITNKTEAWEFIIDKKPEEKENKYAVLEKHLDAGYYKAGNNKVYFKFDEEYSSGNVSCSIYNSKRELVLPKVHSDGQKSASLNLKSNGYNRFEIDLNELDIKSGYHTLEVKNEKGQLYLLKFYAQ